MKVMENLSLRMETLTKESGLQASITDKVSIMFPMVDSTLVHGKWGSITVKALLNGLTAINTLACGNKISKMGLGSLERWMVRNI